MFTYCGFSRVYNVVYFSLLVKIKRKSLYLKKLTTTFNHFQDKNLRQRIATNYGTRAFNYLGIRGFCQFKNLLLVVLL